jgi:hypothetical protein
VSSRGYTVLGWVVWKVGTRVARRKLAQTRSKALAFAVIAVVVAAGIALASGDDE